MTESNESHEMPNQNNTGWTSYEYLTKAAEACASGDRELGMHLYLAAYEKGISDPLLPQSAALGGLRQAWQLACDLKERSMAEYVFEKLEPYLSGEEVSNCAEQLQQLALDRLEQIGFSREDLEGMAQLFNQDFLMGDLPIMQVEHFSIPGSFGNGYGSANDDELEVEDEAPLEQPDESQLHIPSFGFDLSQLEVVPSEDAHAGEAEADQADGAEAEAQAEQATQDEQLPESAEPATEPAEGEPATPTVSMPAMPDFGFISANDSRLPGMPKSEDKHKKQPLNYNTLVGYDEAVAIMRDFGVGLGGDERFNNFVDMLNRRHGLDRMPALDSMLFRSVAREDAMRFVEATIGELGLPAMRMSMEENFQGMPVLCVSTQSDNHPRMNQAHNRIEGPATLVIEDLDLWVVPTIPENTEGLNGFVMANMSRGAREAINLIRSAVENPDVYVLATASANEEVDPFFYEMLEPMSVIDIDFPNDSERTDIWLEIVREHPSMRSLNRVDLMRYSSGMPRYDIYMAAREAVEEAYKMGLVTRSYKAVTPQNIFEKLAAYQPLDSDQYRALEQEVIKDFQHDLDHLEDLLDNPWE